MELFELTRALIDIPSVTGDEAEVVYFLSSFLAGLHYHVEIQEVEKNRANIIASTGDAPRVVFSTHTDTVPPHIASSEDDEYIFGRGACDAKGIIAAQIFAAEQLRAGGMNDVGLLFVVDEELSSTGARAANCHPRAASVRYLINGEPTNNQLGVGSKGTLRVLLKTEGRAAHSAYPEAGDSAIEKLLDVLADVRAAAWPIDDFFGETTCNLGTIAGGTRPNVIAAEAHAELLFRLTTDAELVKSILERVIADRASVQYISMTPPMRMRAVEGFSSGIVRFTTDVPHLRNWGTPLLIGPGSILDAHTSHERVAKTELMEAVNLYVALAETLAKQDVETTMSETLSEVSR
ncbi:MAG: M20/M25/M40 family metallo-hydrolase [Pyrinomonadaceae bacterium]|nr:M20/M25/M40 family metallo-hydrolase [Pyrinomonadaceae bacterium]